MLNKLICFFTSHLYTGEKKIQDFDRLGITKFSWACQRCGKEEFYTHYYNPQEDLIREYVNSPQHAFIINANQSPLVVKCKEIQ